MIDRSDDKNDTTRIGEVTIQRRIDHDNDLLFVTGDFRGMVTAYKEHIRRWENSTDDLGLMLMAQGMGAAAMHLSCRPRTEVVGWTLNIQQPPTNLFITGDSERRTITGRVFTQDVRTTGESRMFVQTSKAGAPVVQSTVPVSGLDVFLMFEQYYAASEQTPARFFEINDDFHYLMILALPDADDPMLESLTRDDAVELSSQKIKDLDSVTYRFQCGCNPERILELLVNIYKEDAEPLFRGDPGVEALCPRCGRRWWVSRNDFVAAVDADRQGGDDEDGESEIEQPADG